MTMHDEPAEPGAGAALPLLGYAVTSVSPDALTAGAAAMLIAMLAHDGENVAAMVPVETGLDDPCDPGSHGALIRWAAGHMDDPRHVTPFALEADRSAMHAADASGTLLHGAAFDHARDALSDGRTALVVMDAIGPLDPITPSLTMLDLMTRWALTVLIVEPISRCTVGHVRLLSAVVASRGLHIGGVVLTARGTGHAMDDDEITAIRESIPVLIECPVVLMPHVQSLHDRNELLAAAQSCGLHRVTSRRTA